MGRFPGCIVSSVRRVCVLRQGGMVQVPRLHWAGVVLMAERPGAMVLSVCALLRAPSGWEVLSSSRPTSTEARGHQAGDDPSLTSGQYSSGRLLGEDR